MVYGLRVLTAILLCGVGVASAADRLAVFETFGNPSGAYCRAAGPALKDLQTEMEGQAVLLEYDYNQVAGDVVSRFDASAGWPPFLPLVMVGSGYRTTSGWETDHRSAYLEMIDAELARAPRAEVRSYWQRLGNVMRTYVSVRNSGSIPLRVVESTRVWVVVYEKAPIGVSNTWVRSTVSWSLVGDLAPGQVVTKVIDAQGSSVADWNRIAGVAMLEDRPGGSGRYDMLQAAESLQAALTVVPQEALVSPSSSTAELKIEGPHVLNWTASTTVPWLELTPSAGTLPSTVTVTLRPELRPPTETSATVRVDAAGDGMTFQAQVEVKIGARMRRATGRLSPVE